MNSYDAVALCCSELYYLVDSADDAVGVLTTERKALGIRVVDFCREAHISRVTYYELLKGNATP